MLSLSLHFDQMWFSLMVVSDAQRRFYSDTLELHLPVDIITSFRVQVGTELV